MDRGRDSAHADPYRLTREVAIASFPTPPRPVAEGLLIAREPGVFWGRGGRLRPPTGPPLLQVPCQSGNDATAHQFRPSEAPQTAMAPSIRDISWVCRDISRGQPAYLMVTRRDALMSASQASGRGFPADSCGAIAGRARVAGVGGGASRRSPQGRDPGARGPRTGGGAGLSAGWTPATQSPRSPPLRPSAQESRPSA
jgi:hypothetical protein